MSHRLVLLWAAVLGFVVGPVAFAQDNANIWNQAKRWKLGLDASLNVRTVQESAPATLNPDSPPNQPDIQVFNPSNFWQSENSIGVNFANASQLMVSTNGRIPGSNPVVHQTWAFSTDGGVTWPSGLQSEDIPPGIVDCFGDPVAFFDVSGRGYYCTLGSPGGIYFVSTTNFGATWSARSNADNLNSTNDDKQHAAADYSGTFPNNVYAAWTDFGISSAPVLFNRSTNQGQTWGTRQTLQIGSNRGQGVHIAIGPNGEVYLTWAHYTASGPESGIGFAKSTDGGVTFSTPVIAFPITGIREVTPSSTWNGVRVNSFPYHDVDRSNGPRRGWIYVTYSDRGSGNSDIFMRRSSDGGANWSAPILVDDQPSGRQQFMSSIAVDPTTGGITISYYNMDSTGSNFMTNRYAAYSADGGNTWERWVISDVRALWAPQGTPSTNTTYNGDYYETTAMGGKAWAIWTDRRSGSTGASNRAYVERIIYGENFGWIKGTVTNSNGGAPVGGAAIDFTQNVLQQGGITTSSGSYFAGALVDTPGTTANLSLRARKFGFRDTVLAVTLTRNDTLTRNFAMTPAAGGTLSIHAYRVDNSNIRASVRVLFGTLEVINDYTDSTTGNFSAPLPTGTYTLIIDPPSPYGTLNYPNTVINANQTTQINALVHSVVEYSPAAMRDTLAVGQVRAKTMVLTNTTTDSVRFRLSDDVALDRMKFMRTPVQPNERPFEAPQRPKGAPDSEFGDSPTGGGGPDAFGYKWVDSDSAGGGVTFNWFDIDAIGTLITTWTGSGDDGTYNTALPWSFPFYGNSYSSVNICTNGFISFTSTSTAYTNVAIPNSAEPNNAIYAFWDDLAVSTRGRITYYNDAPNSRFIVQYTGVPHLSSTTDTLTFQVILKPNGEVLVQYLKMIGTSTLTSATIGIEDAAGSVGLQVVYNATYVHNNLALKYYLPDAPWISENPFFGTLPPMGNQNITVTFDATGLTQGTTYSGKIAIDATHPDVAGSIIVPASLKVEAASQPLLILNKLNIPFPATPLASTSRDSVTARNGGALPLNITSITSNNARFVVTPASATVPPGDSVKIRINYTPTVPAIDTGRVIILSNSQGEPRKDITLSGSGFGQAHIAAAPDSFTFSRPPGNDTTRATLKIRNTGTDTLYYAIDEALGSSLASVVRSTQQQAQRERSKEERDHTPGDPILDGAGGPDAFGYRWIDSDEPGGPAYNWVDIRPMGTQISTWTSGTADDGSVILPLPFGFKFYGTSYTQLKVCTNGWMGFDIVSTSNAYANGAIPSASTQPNNAIYPWWDDLDLRTSGTVHYYHDAANARFIVQYTEVPHYATTGPGLYTFEAMLYQNGNILVQYQSMQQTLNSATIGVEDAPGAVALQVVNEQLYVHDNLALLISNDIVPWLSADRTSGMIVQGDSQNVEVRIHPGSMAGGQYTARLRVSGNSPDTVSVPVRLTVVTDVRPEASLIPASYELTQNYPNPFNPTTKISFGLPHESHIRLKVYNLLGQEVVTLADEVQPAGYFSVDWDSHSATGAPVASGIYFYRFEATSTDGKATFTSLKKMLLIK